MSKTQHAEMAAGTSLAQISSQSAFVMALRTLTSSQLDQLSGAINLIRMTRGA